MTAIDSQDYETFEEWWEEVIAYANHFQMAIHHVEEEFVIDGVFYPVFLRV